MPLLPLDGLLQHSTANLEKSRFAVTKAFDPKEPRNPHSGEWTSGESDELAGMVHRSARLSAKHQGESAQKLEQHASDLEHPVNGRPPSKAERKKAGRFRLAASAKRHEEHGHGTSGMKSAALKHGGKDLKDHVKMMDEAKALKPGTKVRVKETGGTATVIGSHGLWVRVEDSKGNVSETTASGYKKLR